MEEKEILNLIVTLIGCLSAGLSGYCFGKADGIRFMRNLYDKDEESKQLEIK